MKTVLFTALMTLSQLLSSGANAAYVYDARFNPETEEINLEVVYFGGCESHQINLQFQHCSRMNPTACVAAITDTGAGDSCDQILGETVSIPTNGLYKKNQLQKLVIVGEDGTSAEIDFSRIP